MINRAQLQQVVQGQAERNILEKSKGGYLSKMKVMTHMLNKFDDIRIVALYLDENGAPLYHTGI